MPDELTLQTKLYPLGEGRMFSVEDLLEYFTKQGTMRVSDLHLKVGCPPTYRIDGRLTRLKGSPLTDKVMEQVTRVLLSEQDQQTLRDQRSVDSSMAVGIKQFRLNIFHDNDGLVAAVRALESTPPRVEDIGFPNDVWKDILRKQQGLVLITGITGSGKSTTIASLIDRILETKPVRVITLEDPVEYRLKTKVGMVSQREVGRDVPSFEYGLRDALREDPDVIFVGEMRDRDSASWTLTAAETGHLVFSTLHTRDCRGSITRLLDMFPADRKDEVANQLSLGLSHVICQKLLPRADGKGRLVAMEILNNSYAVANQIRMQKIEQLYSVMQTKVRDVPEERMVTMEKSLVNLVQYGHITAEEAEKWANDWTSFHNELSHAYQRQQQEMDE
ncbi:MAG: PilT/PilU family type 4a pilus ATPase [Phycisphaeraceae bacterium]